MFDTFRSVLKFRRLELDGEARRLRTAASVDDLRRIAKRRLPGGVFDYVDGAAESERTMLRNEASFSDIVLHPRVLRDVSAVDPSTELFGRRLPMPLVLAPTGFTRIVDPEGELAVARAAARSGLPYTLSTLATRSIEEVAAVSAGPRWFQVYVWRDRGLVRDMLDRAHRAGFEAIMITVDTAVLGRRERDVRRGFTLPPKIGLDTLIDGAVHPAWTWRLARSEPIVFANVAGSGSGAGDGTDAVSLSDYINAQFDPALSWDAIDWFREAWPGRILIKGVQRADDAVRAVERGIDGVILSNHGGRQLDGGPSPIELVGPVVDAIGSEVPVICDGGVRRGADVVRALALGAKVCMIGRPYLYGLAAGGEAGVDHVLAMFDEGIRRTMALCGVRSIGDIDGDLLFVGRDT